MRTLTSLSHPLIKHLVRLREQRPYRKEQGTLLIQGHKMVAEVSQTAQVLRLLVTDPTFLIPGVEEALLVSEAVMEKIAGVAQPEGIAAEIIAPVNASLKNFSRILVLDGIADPGNLGTLLRTALALGWQGAYLLENCCDPYNDKALRAAMGATFRLPLSQGTLAELQLEMKAFQGTRLFADTKGTPLNSYAPPQTLVLILGSESHGVSPSCREWAAPITIPMPGEMESLNVATAGAILMYCLREPCADER